MGKIVDMCATCGKELATCSTIWAAAGILYCSRDCGIEACFDSIAEELNPADIDITGKEENYNG